MNETVNGNWIHLKCHDLSLLINSIALVKSTQMYNNMDPIYNSQAVLHVFMILILTSHILVCIILEKKILHENDIKILLKILKYGQ